MSDFLETQAEEEGIEQLFDADTDSFSEDSEDREFIAPPDIEPEDNLDNLLAFHNASVQAEDRNVLAELDCLFGKRRSTTDPDTPDKPSKPKLPSKPSNPSNPSDPQRDIVTGDEVSETLSPKMGEMQIATTTASKVPRRQLFNCSPEKPNNAAGSEMRASQGARNPNLPASQGGGAARNNQDRIGDSCPDSGFNESVQSTCAEPLSTEVADGSASEEYGSKEGQEELSQESVTLLRRTELTKETLALLETNCAILRKSKDIKVTMLGIFKKHAGFSFMQLVRPFKSDKTQTNDWIVLSIDNRVEYWNEFICRQEDICTYMYTVPGIHCMYLSFFNSKNRRGVINFLKKGGLGVDGEGLQIQPPNIRIMMNAVYWLKSAIHGKGPMPAWVETYFDDAGNQAEVDRFEMATMVQWALDHKLYDVDRICYHYSLEASNNNPNAKAWMDCNNMYKYASDCAKLARAMTKGRVCSMTMHEYLTHRMETWEERGNSASIMKLLYLQGIMYVDFMHALKSLINKVPKKCCIAIVGPPNTGKSMFCMSLMKFLDGKVLSYFAHKSHFWLSPLADTKVALIEDCTWSCWDYIDTYLRGALDGTQLTIDQKNKDPKQIECPPIIITSNYDFTTGEAYGGDGKRSGYPYLKSRITKFCFPKQISKGNSKPKIIITPEDWADFFIRYKEALGLQYIEDGEFATQE